MSDAFDFSERNPLIRPKYRPPSGGAGWAVVLAVLAACIAGAGGVLFMVTRSERDRPPPAAAPKKPPASGAQTQEAKRTGVTSEKATPDPKAIEKQRQANEALEILQRQALLADEERKRRDRQAEVEIALLPVPPDQKARAREMRRLLKEDKLDLEKLPGHDQWLFFNNLHVFTGPEARKAILAYADKREDCRQHIDNLRLKGTPHEAKVKIAFMLLSFRDKSLALIASGEIKTYGLERAAFGPAGQFIREHRDLFLVP